MGNVNSTQLDAGGVSRPLEVSIQGPTTKSWATMDHSLSGPWSFLVKEEVQCLCEGGRSCAHENPARQHGPSAIAGLHSNWVGDSVLAMARPWQDNVLKHDVVSQFKQHNIGMILNLQEVGEHESCGPGNLAVSGFTYNPETFMAAKIGVYNISWRDMGVPTLEKIMDIVQIMQYITLVERRKVAVHCHAGLGRTGLAIACFLLASGQACSAAAAVELVRASRPGALQTQAQVMFVSIFEQYLQHLRCLFKVADLKNLSLGNTNYVVTKVCRRISRSMSGHTQGSTAGTPDAAAAAAAALGPLLITPPGSGGSSIGSSAPGTATSAAASAAGQPDWASATYELMAPSEAAQLAAAAGAAAKPPGALAAAGAAGAGVPGAAEAAANSALNLGPNAAAAGSGKEGLVMHARRMSGGGSMKVLSNLRAIEEEGDKPVHVIQTDNAVTEVYGHGLTIIRATDSVKKLYAPPAAASVLPEQRPPEQQLLTPHVLGLDKQLPWNDRFAIRPEAFKAEGWLPEPPSSYLEALRRQQRLLHGNERRRCLHQHKILRSAAKALAAAAEAYKAVAAHTDPSQIIPSGATAAVNGSPSFKRTHSRSRSNASAIDLLAVAGGLSPNGSGIPLQDLPRAPSGSGAAAPAGVSLGVGAAAAAGAAGTAGGAAGAGGSTGASLGSLLSKQHQQQQLAGSLQALPGASGHPTVLNALDSAAALLPGIHLGPPGTAVGPSADGSAAAPQQQQQHAAGSSSGGANSGAGAASSKRLARQGSSAKRLGAASAAAANSAPAAAGAGFFLAGSAAATSAVTAAGQQQHSGSCCAQQQQQQHAGATAAAGGPCCTPCLSGCCAPSFAVGLLIALLYKGRFPEEYEAQWSSCPRLKVLGLDEGHAVCQALQDVKLAVNGGSFSALEAASGAVAVCVLADWFEGFTQEAFTEATLEMLVDEAEALLAEALAAAATNRAREQQQQQHNGQVTTAANVTSSSSTSSSGRRLPPVNLPCAVPEGGTGSTNSSICGSNSNSTSGGTSSNIVDPPIEDAAVLASKAAAKAVCAALAPYEQDLCLLLAAVLRHARHASLEDPRLRELGLNSSSSGGGGSSGGCGSSDGSGAAAAVVEAQVDAAMAVLYRLVAGWLLGPLALVCVPALEAVAAFLHYLTVDDGAYGCLLQAIQQGVRRARSAPAGKGGGLWDSLDATGGTSNGLDGSSPNSPRAQAQHNQDRLEKLKARLLGAGSSFKLKPLSAYRSRQQQQKPALLAAAAGPAGVAAAAGGGVAGERAKGAGAMGPSAPGALPGSLTAAQHSIGKSKLRHASSSPELCNAAAQLAQQQQQQRGPSGVPQVGKHGASKLGRASAPTSLAPAAAGTSATAGPAAASTAAGPAAAATVGVGGSKEAATTAAAGGPVLQVSCSSPEPPKGCADALTHMLLYKRVSRKSTKEQQPCAPQQQQQGRGQAEAEAAAPVGLKAAVAVVPDPQQQQQAATQHASTSRQLLQLPPLSPVPEQLSPPGSHDAALSTGNSSAAAAGAAGVQRSPAAAAAAAAVAAAAAAPSAASAAAAVGALSPGASVSSSCGGDSMSEVVAVGNCQELCVGHKNGGHLGEDDSSEVLGVLTHGDRRGPGALESPPCSTSPELTSPTAATAHVGHVGFVGLSSSGSGSGSGSGNKHQCQQQQQGPHMRLPPMAISRDSLDACDDTGSSFTGSVCSSMGSITGLVLAAQQQQQHQPVGPGASNNGRISAAAGAAAAAAASGGVLKGVRRSSDRPVPPGSL